MEARDEFCSYNLQMSVGYFLKKNVALKECVHQVQQPHQINQRDPMISSFFKTELVQREMRLLCSNDTRQIKASHKSVYHPKKSCIEEKRVFMQTNRREP